MKNTIKLLGIIAVNVIIGFFILACSDSHVCVFGGWKVTTPASCSTAGVESRTCTHDGCNETETRNLPALGHNFGGWNITVAAGCTTTGTETRTCTRANCNETETRNFPALGHNFSGWNITVAAGCTTTGTETGTCTRANCNETSTRSITALGHNFSGWEVTIPAACTEGEETGTCTRENCNQTSTRSITALGHNFSGWAVTIPASCTEGTETGTCTRENCNQTGTRSIALGHNFGGWVTTILPTVSTAGQERRTCQRSGCSFSETRSLSYSAPPTVTIQNNTGYTIGGYNGGIWIKSSTEAYSWGTNLASTTSSSLADGQSRAYTLTQPLSTNNVYDFNLRQDLSSNPNFFRKYGVTVTDGMIITFTASDLDGGSKEPRITIQNRSGVNFNSIHIKPSTSSAWSASYDSISNNNNLTARIIIPPSNYTVFDIQARSTNPTNTYTLNNVTVTNGMTIMFTSADADSSTISNPVIVIQNNTGYTIGGNYGGLWIKLSTEAYSWGTNLVSGTSSSGIADGQSRAFTLTQPLSTNSVYDFHLEQQSSSNRNVFRKYGVSITEGMIITFTTSDLYSERNVPRITIQNRSGINFNSIHIKPSVSSTWSASYNSLSNNSNLTADILIPSFNYTKFDIQARSTNPTNTYTLNDVTVTDGMTIMFTSADADSTTISNPVIVIQNITGYTIGGNYGGLWIKLSTEASWGTNLVSGTSSNGIADGQSRAFTLTQPLSTNSVYDFHLEQQSSSNRNVFRKYGVSITEGMIIAFTNDDLE